MLAIILLVVGASLTVSGTALMSVPWALIVAGVLILAVAVDLLPDR